MRNRSLPEHLPHRRHGGGQPGPPHHGGPPQAPHEGEQKEGDAPHSFDLFEDSLEPVTLFLFLVSSFIIVSLLLFFSRAIVV